MKDAAEKDLSELEELEGERGIDKDDLPTRDKRKFRFPRDVNYTYLLLGLVAVFSFSLGYLYNEVRFLEGLLQ